MGAFRDMRVSRGLQGLDKVSQSYFSGPPRTPSTLAKKILVTHRCEKIWFYSHDVIDRPYIRTSVRPSTRSCKSNVKRRTVTSLQAHS